MAETITIQETTQADVSDHYVGVGNIWERDLEGPDGRVEARMSARIFVFDPHNEKEWDVTAIVGTEIALNGVVWKLTLMDEGEQGPGYVVLERKE